MEKLDISVLGCCVSRDTLEFNCDKYNIKKYVAFTSPYSMYNGKPINISIDIENVQDLTNFVKRMLNLDACKKTVEYLLEVPSKWLLFDIADARQPVIKFEKGDVVLTYNSFVQSYLNSLVERGIYGGAKIFNVNELSENELIEAVNHLLVDICEVYSTDQIIVHQFYRSNDFICKGSYYREFSPNTIKYNNIWNGVISKLNEICINKLSGCHIIPAIPNVIADENNKWGLSPYHFCDIYYEYAERAISVITERYERDVEEEKLLALWELYTEKFNVLRERAKHNLTRLDRERLRGYASSFFTIINNDLLELDEDGKTFLEHAFLAKGHKRIAIYGDTEITKVLCKVLGGGTTVSIEYIVENSKQPVKGFKTVDRNPANYPDCDVMLIADIFRFKDIEVKLKKLQVPFPFYNAAEYIKSLPTPNK